jgi:hypothetical protein
MAGKSRTDLWLDVSILADFAATTGTGLLVWLVVREGPANLTFASLDHDAWREIHQWLAISTLAGTAIHLVRHRRWLSATARRFPGVLPRRVRLDFVLACLISGTFFIAGLSGLAAHHDDIAGHRGIATDDRSVSGRNAALAADLLGPTLASRRTGETGPADRVHLLTGLAMGALLTTHVTRNWRRLAGLTRRSAAPAAKPL